MTSHHDIVVIGAGMVGVCCALHLQRAGFEVTLIDRRGPGSGASSGNLGCFGIASCVPACVPGIASCVPACVPGIAWKAPGMLLDGDAPLKIHWPSLPRLLPWFAKFAAASRPDRVEAIARARQSLLDKAHESVDPLIEAADATHLISRTGLLFVFESEQAFRGASYAFDLRRRNGVEMDLLDGNEARQVEPALSPHVVRACRVPHLAHTLDPLRLVQALADHFRRRGGRFLQAEVGDFETGPDGVQALSAGGETVAAGQFVLAAGAWSRTLAARLGTDVPLVAERGYHSMYSGAELKMRTAVLSVDRHVSVTPMLDGIRVGGIAEFAAVDAPPNPRHAALVRRHGEALFPGLRSDERSDWMGPRPAHPDCKPVIGRSPRHRNVLFAFGHDHLGLTMGGITGQLIAELAAGQPTRVNLTPFRPDRF